MESTTTMRILLIHLEKDSSLAGRLCNFLQTEEFFVETLCLLSLEKIDESFRTQPCEARFIGYFLPDDYNTEDQSPDFTPDHVLIISPLPACYLNFLAGYSCSTGIRFPVFGEQAMEVIPQEFSRCFSCIRTEERLLAYLKEVKAAYEKSELERESSRAKDKLLKMGIPVNVESLTNCAAEGYLHEIILFMAAGFSPDALSKDGIPLLNIAARNGNRETLRLLIHSGAQLNLLSEDRGSTALIDSVIGNQSEITRELIKAGADVNIKNNNGQTALVVAVGAGNLGIIEALVGAGADPDLEDSIGMSARKYALIFHKDSLLDIFSSPIPNKV